MTQHTLLAVLAHPDDETFGIGGTLALYASKGVAIHLVCTTNGDAGDMPAGLLEGFKSIAERRQHELHCAAEALGLAGVHLLGYRDSGMAGTPDNLHPGALINAPLDEVTRKIVHLIRRLQPQVVITHDPIGGYKHPDHITTHQAATAAFFAASDPRLADELPPFAPQKLFFHSMSKAYLRLSVQLMRIIGRDPRKYGRNHDIDLLSLTEINFPTHAAINYRSVTKVRDNASACHVSQGGAAQSLTRRLMKWLSPKETFMQAYPTPQEGKISTDLFENIP